MHPELSQATASVSCEQGELPQYLNRERVRAIPMVSPRAHSADYAILRRWLRTHVAGLETPH
jgi:hypothetical protein